MKIAAVLIALSLTSTQALATSLRYARNSLGIGGDHKVLTITNVGSNGGSRVTLVSQVPAQRGSRRAAPAVTSVLGTHMTCSVLEPGYSVTCEQDERASDGFLTIVTVHMNGQGKYDVYKRVDSVEPFTGVPRPGRAVPFAANLSLK